ncbi:MAG: 3-phosphoshikimate 1-carboxyvinyltransferase [Oscillibacter sp.]
MKLSITPAHLSGSLAAIPSKSDAHRLLICAALADKPTILDLPATSADIEATLHCLEALGAGVEKAGSAVTVTPIQAVAENPLLDCGESGSTLRFLLPVAASLSPHVRFTGQGRLPTRPLGPLRTAMERRGVAFSADSLPFETHGRLESGAWELPGDVSSQYVTGLLLALPRLPGDSALTLTTPLQSAAYVDLTLHALRRFGVSTPKTDQGWSIPGGQVFSSPGRLRVDGDWSNAAFFLAAGAMGESVCLTGLEEQSPQGDKEMVAILRRFGGKISTAGGVSVSPGPLRGQRVDVSEIPDLLPILAVLAAVSQGDSQFVNAGRLRFKESDRLQTTAALVNALGGRAEEQPEGLTVYGGQPLAGGTVDGAGDHRIVMAAAIAATCCHGPVTILGAEAVDKSYPGFWEAYKQLGGNFHVL